MTSFRALACSETLQASLSVLDSNEEHALLQVRRQPIEALHSDVIQHVGIQH